MPFYAVRRGFQPGVYSTWDECKAQVNGFKGAQFKKFPTREEAEAFKQGGSGPSSVPHPTLGRPKGSTSASDPSSSADPANPSSASSTSTASSDAAESEASSDRPSSAGKAAGGHRSSRSARSAPYQTPERPHRKPSSDAAPAPSPDTTPMKQSIASIRGELSALKEQVSRYVAGLAASPPRSATAASAPPAPDQFVVDADGFLNVWTDGACAFNGQHGARAGVGVWFNSAHPLNVSAPVDGPATNNNAEIQAAWVALELAAAAGHRRVQLHTDSKFVIDCATRWMDKWQKNGWQLSAGGPVKNRTQLEALARAMDAVEIKWNYVAGHSGVEGNEGADRLAVTGAQRYKAPSS